jgi:membrane protease YdiL (CAAX protease family)
LGTGLLAGVIVFTLLQVLLWPFVLKFIEYDSPDVGIYDMAQSGLGNLILIICLSWIVAGLYEEIAFHGFIFTRLEKMISGKNATALSFWITALIFGLYHYQLGTLGWVNAFMAGAVYLGLFLYFKRNLWYATICHGTYNTLVFVFIYNGWL